MDKNALLLSPCKLCKQLYPEKAKCNMVKMGGCNVWLTIFFEQWDATCRLIRERTGKKK